MKFFILVQFAWFAAIALDLPTTHEYECTAVQNYYWRDYTFNWVPHDAIKAAEDVFIGQVYYEESILPASIYKHEAITEMRGKRVITERVKILCDTDPDRFYWVEIDYRNTDDVLKGYTDYAIQGGYQDGYATYIGRALHEGQWKVGKVVPKEIPTSGLQVWDKDGNCAIIPDFEILKYKAGCVY
ncbi:hypothetical protein Trydic_g3047 [Trypoxylus dichotomus]